jgi:hypothetical protein
VLADGRWTSTPPAVPRIATAEAVRRLGEDVKKFRDPERVAARGDAFKDVVDGLIADFERRVAGLRPATTVDASGLMAWSEAVRDSPVFREDPSEGARVQADPASVSRAREAQKQLGEASYDVESLRASTADGAAADSGAPSGKLPAARTDGLVPLFNGKDLSGWVDLLPNGSEWKVVDGILEGRGAGTPGKPGVLVLRRDDLSDFRLRARMRHRKGFMSWVEVRRRPRGDVVNSYAITTGNWPNHQTTPAGSVISLKNYHYGQETRTTSLASKVGVAADEWFDLTIDVRKNRIVTSLNGKPVGEYVDPEGTNPSGGLALFCPGDAAAEYQSITLEESPDRPPTPATTTRADARGWRPLFNGKNLDDFDIGWPAQHRWSVVDGTIVSAGPGTYTVLNTKRDYSDFHLRLETMPSRGVAGSIDFRWKGPLAAGSFYSISIAGSVDGPGPQKTGNIQLWTAGKRADVGSASDPPAPLAPGRWFPMEIIAVGDTIRVLVEGREVAHYRDPKRTLTSGPIGLFCRPGATMRFRNLQIKDLTATPGG